MRKFFKQIHLYLSIPIGLIFCMMCVTGAILVFEDEITDAYYADARRIAEGGETALDEDTLKEKLAPQLPEGAEIRGIAKSEKADEAWKVRLAKPRGKAFFVNQYTGEIMGDAGMLPFFSTTRSLHRWFLDAPKDGSSLGKKITGWSTAIALIIVLTGFILWLPRKSQKLISRLKMNFKSRFATWYTFHYVWGFYTLLIMLLVLITGLTWSFVPWREMIMSVTGKMSYEPIHTGKWLGIIGKILWLVTALVGAALPITGYYMWLKRTLRKGSK